jgi:hypothetical protein
VWFFTTLPLPFSLCGVGSGNTKKYCAPNVNRGFGQTEDLCAVCTTHAVRRWKTCQSGTLQRHVTVSPKWYKFYKTVCYCWRDMVLSVWASHKATECSMVEPKEAETKESVHAKESSKDTANRYLWFQRNHSQGSNSELWLLSRSPQSFVGENSSNLTWISRVRFLVASLRQCPTPTNWRSCTIFLARKGIRVLDHPPYSPDFAPADFCCSKKLSWRWKKTVATMWEREGTAVLNAIP